MENDELHRIEMLGFDEKAETWFLDMRDTRKLTLTRQTLNGLAHLYNSVHTGNPLLLCDRKTVRRLEENNQRLSETIRDLYFQLDQREQNRPHRVVERFIGWLLRPLIRSARRLA
jgi:hypothetical protein